MRRQRVPGLMADDPAGWTTLTVKVTPGSRKGPLVEVDPDTGAVTVFVRERAVDGRATAAAGAVLAEHLGLRRSDVELVSGMTSRHKRFRVPAAAADADRPGPR